MSKLETFYHSRFYKVLFFIGCIGRICNDICLLKAAGTAIRRGDEAWWDHPHWEDYA